MSRVKKGKYVVSFGSFYLLDIVSQNNINKTAIPLHTVKRQQAKVYTSMFFAKRACKWLNNYYETDKAVVESIDK